MINEGHLFLVAIVVLSLMAFQQRKRKNLLMFMFAADSVLCIHYMLNSYLCGIGVCIFGGLRNLLYAQRDEHKILRIKILPYIFSVCMVALGVVFWNGPFTVLFVAGNIVKCFGYRCRRTTQIRQSVLISSSVLIVYEIFAGTIIGGLYELLLIISAVMGLIKFKNADNHR